MMERAVAAVLAVALSSALVYPVNAQATHKPSTAFGAPPPGFAAYKKRYQTGFSANQTSTNTINIPGSTPDGWLTSQQNGIWTPGASSSQASTQSRSAATTTAPAVPAAPATAVATPGAPGSKKKAQDTFTVVEGTPNVAKAAKWQRFQDWITLKAGQDQLSPLNLVITNSGFQSLKIQLSGRVIATDKEFQGGVFTTSVAGAISVGDNQLVIQGFGPAGAKISWKVVTLRPSLATATPTQVSPGQDVTLAGKNFSGSKSVNQVMFGDKPGVVKTSTTKQIVATVPDGVAGDQNVVVWVGGIPTKPLKITIKGAPEVTGVDMISSPPGQTIVVSGKGFSAKAGENQVLIGGSSAQIVSVSATSITCIIPEIESPQWNVPIQVKTNNVTSKGNVTINVQRRVIENQGVPES